MTTHPLTVFFPLPSKYLHVVLTLFVFVCCRHSNVSNNSPWEGSCCGSSYNNVSTETSGEEVTKYRVVMLGEAGVGKTALVSQFMTSEYMNTYDASLGK